MCVLSAWKQMIRHYTVCGAHFSETITIIDRIKLTLEHFKLSLFSDSLILFHHKLLFFNITLCDLAYLKLEKLFLDNKEIHRGCSVPRGYSKR